uniref:Probable magnesium transporter n=1 Tax=Oryza nivara TaxID=4536 RepID=A0A0E0G6V9_ORYNI
MPPSLRAPPDTVAHGRAAPSPSALARPPPHRARRRPTESRTYASPTARARSRIGEVLIPEGMVTSIDNVRGLTLAISSSAFIGSSFIIKKIGLKKAGDSGVLEVSHTCMSHYVILGEVANFAAYAFAPAVLVTPLGALSIIFSAVLAHFVLKEKLHMFGVVGCILCVVGSVGIVLHAPKEREIDSIDEIWHLATEPGFIVYSCVAVVSVLFLIFWVAERSGHRKMLVYIAICSTMGSLTVISVKAVAIALKLSFGGSNQFIYIQTWFFILNYLNKALDSFNTAVVSPVYYVMFTILTIFANMIMYKDSFSRNATQIATQLCGFVTIVAGTFLLHKTRDMGNEPPLPDDEICLDGGSVRPDRLSQSSS